MRNSRGRGEGEQSKQTLSPTAKIKIEIKKIIKIKAAQAGMYFSSLIPFIRWVVQSVCVVV